MDQSVNPDLNRDCPTFGTWDDRDTHRTSTVPFVPRPENGTPSFQNSVLDVEVSCFANYRSPDNPKTVNLLTWLTSSKYRKVVEAIRATADKKERDRIKATLPAITPSGLFSRRTESALIQHSGLLCLDIDQKGNEHIANYANLKQQLSRIQNVAYCGRSVSGTGYFLLVLIAQPTQHGSHFKALRELFKEQFGIRVDDTPDVSRLRGYSFDPDGYFNHQPVPFTVIYTPPVIPVKNKDLAYQLNPDGLDSSLLQRCIRLIEDAPDGQKHAQLNRAAFTAGGFIAAGRVNEGEAITVLEDAIRRKANVTDLRAADITIRNGIRDGKQQPIYEDSPQLTSAISSVPLLGHGTFGTPKPVLNTGHAALTIAEPLTSLDSILKPDESQIERLTVEPFDSYPDDWGAPATADEKPKIKQQTFFEWQRNHPAFSGLGLASLQSNSKQ